jgi:4-hydroxythreonine-4-phosphate dehydrogenase
MTKSLPRIAITMGDPAGVGPEVCLHLLANPEISSICTPVIFGDASVLRECARTIGMPAPEKVVEAVDWPATFAALAEPAVLDLRVFDVTGFTPGTVSAATGAAAFHYVEKSISAALSGDVAAVSTGPLNKEALHAAGIRFPGHTEIFAARTNAARACMLQYSEEVRASFVTTHVGYHEVPALLTIERILDVIELTADAMRRIRGTVPKLAVLGLNPHAGEHGLFGNREEERIIIPAIEAARARGYDVEGPLPPDTAFLPWKRRATDAFICMYHDQGHIPLKALAFDSAVNTTLGLPIIRTSVDHGTACDIAWQGKANPGSLFEAVKLAVRLTA